MPLPDDIIISMFQFDSVCLWELGEIVRGGSKCPNGEWVQSWDGNASKTDYLVLYSDLAVLLMEHPKQDVEHFNHRAV